MYPEESSKRIENSCLFFFFATPWGRPKIEPAPPALEARSLFFFFHFWLCWVFIAAHGLSLVAVSRGYSSLWCAGFSLQWLLLLRSMGSRHAGFSSCGSWSLERRLSSCWCTGLVAPRHVESSQTRDQVRVPCIGRQILNHCTTREALI